MTTTTTALNHVSPPTFVYALFMAHEMIVSFEFLVTKLARVLLALMFGLGVLTTKTTVVELLTAHLSLEMRRNVGVYVVLVVVVGLWLLWVCFCYGVLWGCCCGAVVLSRCYGVV